LFHNIPAVNISWHTRKSAFDQLAISEHSRMAPTTKILSHGSRLVEKLKTYWFGKKIGSY
jgi:hypothetical protein